MIYILINAVYSILQIIAKIKKLFMICSGLAHDLFMNYSWLAHSLFMT